MQYVMRVVYAGAVAVNLYYTVTGSSPEIRWSHGVLSVALIGVLWWARKVL